MKKHNYKYCPSCGNPLSGEETFCGKCGTTLCNSENVSTDSQKQVNPPLQSAGKPKSSKLKTILIIAGVAIIILILLAVIGNSDTSESTSPGTAGGTAAINETTAEENPSNTGSEDTAETTQPVMDIDLAAVLQNIGETSDVSFSLSEDQSRYITEHPEFFPVTEEVLPELPIDYSLSYAYMIKNPQKYVGQFAFLDGLNVIQIWEESFSDSEYGNFTILNLSDDVGNLYYVYFVGPSINAVEDSLVRVVAMPIEYTGFENIEGNTRLTLAMVAALVEGYDTQDMSGQFFTDEPDYYEETYYSIEMDNYILPYSDSLYYSTDELMALSKEELRLARNEIYARHGRKFETEDLNAYFSAQPWYYGYLSMDEFDDSVLNEYEKANLDTIKAVEAQK